MPAPKDLTGLKFGRLTAIRYVRSRGGKRYWLCRCDCGGETEVSQSNLGRSVFSCGCLQNETRAANGRRHRRHGMRGTREYKTWVSMLGRCRNPNHPAFHNYGGRGINVCARWRKFENFYTDMGAKPVGLELDRIDNNGNYEPGNCRWTTRSENHKNRRTRVRDASGRYTPLTL